MLCLDKNHDRLVLGHLGGFVSLWDTSRIPISPDNRTEIQSKIISQDKFEHISMKAK